MTVFRQENLEEHYETGEDLGRWVRAGGGNPLPRRGEGRRGSCRLGLASRRHPAPSRVPGVGL